MAYCTSSDVQSEIQNTDFDTTTRPTLAEISQFCLDVSGQLDAILKGYSVTVPVTDATTLLFMKRVALSGVCSRVFFAIGQEPEKAKFYQDQFDRNVDMIRKNPNIANPDASGAARLEKAYNSFSDVDTNPRALRMGDRQW